MFLLKARKGVKYLVKNIRADGKAVGRLWKVGIVKGGEISLKRVYFLGGAVVEAGGGYIAIGKRLLSLIEVENV